MQSIARSCLRWLLLYAVIAATLFALAYARFPQARSVFWPAVIGGALLWFSLAYLLGFRERNAELRLIRKALISGRPEDGEKIAAIGTVHSSLETLESPLTRRRCAAYEYKVLPPGNEQAGAYEGFALVPTSIDGPRGSIRLLAAPEFAFPEEQFGAPAHRQNFQEYIASTEFALHEGVNVKRESAHLKQLLADDDGRIRYDIQRQKTVDWNSVTMWEKILAPGEKIVAIGRWSAARGGLVPDTTALLHPVKILKGDTPEVVRSLRKRNRTDAIMSCGCFVPVVIGALIGLTLLPLEAIEQMLPEKDPSWTEVRAERWVQRTLTPNLPFAASGAVEIELEPGQARGKLFVGGETIRLNAAEAKHEGETIELRLTSDATGRGVIVRMRGKRPESVRIIGGGGAIPSYDVEVEQFRVDEQAVTGRLTYLGDRKTGPHLRVTFRARPATEGRASAHPSPDAG
jgi:hypothetical protein